MLKSTTKAQWDAIGIVFIVIILAIAMLYVAMQQKDNTVNNKQDLIDSHLSQSLLNSIMESTTDCNTEMYRVIEDCYGRNDICETDSCVHAADKIKDILKGTLEKWGRPYRIYADSADVRLLDLSQNCSRFDEKVSSGLFFIPTTTGTIVVTLDICKL
ncbi:MAG: hypothetical protein ABIJ34_00505 [archaeon]